MRDLSIFSVGSPSSNPELINRTVATIRENFQPSIRPRSSASTNAGFRSSSRITHPASTFWRRISTPRQEHQVRRFLGVFQERLARRAHLRTHRQTARQVEDLARARGYGKVRRDFSRADRVAESAFHERRGTRGASCRNCRTSASCTSGATHTRRHPGLILPRSHFLRRASGSWRASREESAARGVPSQRERPSVSAYARRARKNNRPLVPEDGIQARPSHAHPGDEIVDRHPVVALRPEHLGRLFQRVPLVEAARSSTGPRRHSESFSSKLLD